MGILDGVDYILGWSWRKAVGYFMLGFGVGFLVGGFVWAIFVK